MEKEGTAQKRRRWYRDWRIWIGALIVLYTITGSTIVPWIAKRQAVKVVREQIGCELSIESVRFNPFTFNASVRGLAMKDLGGRDFLSFEALHVDLSLLPLLSKTVRVDRVGLVAPMAHLHRGTDGVLNAQRIQPPSPEDSGTKEASDWIVELTEVTVENLSVSFTDEMVTPPTESGVDSIYVHARGFRLVPGDTTTFDVSFDMRSGGGGSVGGSAQPFEQIVHASVSLDTISLTPAAPYLAQLAHADLRSGYVSVQGDIDSSPSDGDAPVVLFTGDIEVNDLDIWDSLQDERLLGWGLLRIDDLKNRSVPPATHAEEIEIRDFYTRIEIAEDQSLNFNDVLAPALNRAAGADSTGIEFESKKKKPRTPPDVSFGRIVIHGGEADFEDYSLPLPFATRVHSLSGTITGIARDNPTGAAVKVDGTVGEYGYAEVTGNVDPFEPVGYTDLSVIFRNIELTDLTPYAGKFAGYKIDKGQMSLSLDYVIKDAQLEGDNEIFLEQLNLGDKVQSEEATSLPVKLAVALLKDADGNIDLDLEVSGDLNDPDVSVASLVWQALKGVIINITTAPFRVLGNLLGIDGGEELEYVEFRAGESELLPAQAERLDNLAKALTKRPALVLEMRPTYDEVVDAHAVQAAKYEALLATKLGELAPADSTAPTPANMRFALEGLYKATFSTGALEELRTAHTATDEAGQPTLDAVAYLNAMEQQITDAQPVEEAELAAIANARADAIRGRLVEFGSIAPERVVLDDRETLKEKDDDWVRCRLSLDAK